MTTRPVHSALRKRRVLLVDDHATVREGFAELINHSPDLQVCGEAKSAAEAMEAVARRKPNLAVVDLSLQGGSGLDLIKNLKVLHPLLPMLVVSMHEENLYAARALQAGAQGYVMKREAFKTVLHAIRAVLRGEVFLSRNVREQLLHQMVGGVPPPQRTGVAQLSDRELEIFQLIGEGRTTRQIAGKFHLSVSTVETHRAHVKQKLNLSNPAELMRAAVEWVNAPGALRS
jgi:DNA-binding NarL/FixJ family response regulator